MAEDANDMMGEDAWFVRSTKYLKIVNGNCGGVQFVAGRMPGLNEERSSVYESCSHCVTA